MKRGRKWLSKGGLAALALAASVVAGLLGLLELCVDLVAVDPPDEVPRFFGLSSSNQPIPETSLPQQGD